MTIQEAQKKYDKVNFKLFERDGDLLISMQLVQLVVGKDGEEREKIVDYYVAKNPKNIERILDTLTATGRDFQMKGDSLLSNYRKKDRFVVENYEQIKERPELQKFSKKVEKKLEKKSLLSKVKNLKVFEKKEKFTKVKSFVRVATYATVTAITAIGGFHLGNRVVDVDRFFPQTEKTKLAEEGQQVEEDKQYFFVSEVDENQLEEPETVETESIVTEENTSTPNHLSSSSSSQKKTLTSKQDLKEKFASFKIPTRYQEYTKDTVVMEKDASNVSPTSSNQDNVEVSSNPTVVENEGVASSSFVASSEETSTKKEVQEKTKEETVKEDVTKEDSKENDSNLSTSTSTLEEKNVSFSQEKTVENETKTNQETEKTQEGKKEETNVTKSEDKETSPVEESSSSLETKQENVISDDTAEKEPQQEKETVQEEVVQPEASQQTVAQVETSQTEETKQTETETETTQPEVLEEQTPSIELANIDHEKTDQKSPAAEVQEEATPTTKVSDTSTAETPATSNPVETSQVNDSLVIASVAPQTEVVDASIQQPTEEAAPTISTDSSATQFSLNSVSSQTDSLSNYGMELASNKGTVFKSNSYANSISEQEKLKLAAIVAGEDSYSYEGSLAVVSTVLNRCDTSRFQGYGGKNPYEQIVYPSQFTAKSGNIAKSYMSHPDQIPDFVMAAVEDGLNGYRNHNYTAFRANKGSSREQIGNSGNWYFNSSSEVPNYGSAVMQATK